MKTYAIFGATEDETMRVAPKIELSPEEKTILSKWSRGRSTPARLVLRARVVLLAAEGVQSREIALRLKTSRQTVGLWRSRFAARRCAGIEKDAPRGGRHPRKREKVEHLIVHKTTQERPANATHWTVRTLAKELGIDRSMVHRVWRANGLKPHLVRTFKVSNDPLFLEKLEDVVGLYLNPPEHALVFSADEKSQIQALDRTQPGLPLRRGRAGTMTHDYKRNGTTTLFAAIEMAEGNIIATCMPRHRHQEWIKFLRLIQEQTTAELDVHIIADNYATHKHPKVERWLRRHPRFHLHFIPTSSSWLNVIERFFREITDKRIRRGAFPSVKALVEAIMAYIDAHNAAPKPFQWTAAAEEIADKVGRARIRLKSITA
jgi:transposase